MRKNFLWKRGMLGEMGNLLLGRGAYWGERRIPLEEGGVLGKTQWFSPKRPSRRRRRRSLGERNDRERTWVLSL